MRFFVDKLLLFHWSKCPHLEQIKDWLKNSVLLVMKILFLKITFNMLRKKVLVFSQMSGFKFLFHWFLSMHLSVCCVGHEFCTKIIWISALFHAELNIKNRNYLPEENTVFKLLLQVSSYFSEANLKEEINFWFLSFFLTSWNSFWNQCIFLLSMTHSQLKITSESN